MEQEGGRTEDFGDCSGRVMGACIEVLRLLGPGLLESAYDECLAHEFGVIGPSFERQRALPVSYKGVSLECGYHMTSWR